MSMVVWPTQFSLRTALIGFLALGMALQLSWQAPILMREPLVFVVGIAFSLLSFCVGRIVAFTPATRWTLMAISLGFFLFLGAQWATSFGDDHFLWTMRWMCVGFLVGAGWGPRTHSLPEDSS